MKKFEYVVVMGDSISDRGEMYENPVLRLFSGLNGVSPEGSFTNGYVWTDFLVMALLTGLPPHLLTKERIQHLKRKVDESPDRVASCGARDFFRTYCIGGLTAHDWSDRTTLNPRLEVTEEILSTLEEQRNRLIEIDAQTGISAEQKKATLVFELSGANDLLTVNTYPTDEDAYLALQGRIENLKALIRQGYSDFMLIGLPDLSLTPRYQKKSALEQAELRAVTEKFNRDLEQEILRMKLQEEYSTCNIIFFDINKTFSEIYSDPEKYGFDASKKNTPYRSSPQFNANSSEAAKGFMYWDDVHPTEAMQKLVCSAMYKEVFKSYYFNLPQESPLEHFRDEYGRQWVEDKSGCFGFFRKSRINHLQANLTEILEHGLYNKGYRTRSVLINLGWINDKNEIISRHPDIQAAAAQLAMARSQREPVPSF